MSKSRFLAGLQCQKLLWSHYNAQQLFPPTDSLTQSVLDQGHEVGRFARALYPAGREIGGSGTKLDQTLRETKLALHERRPLFEPIAVYAGGVARIDILNPIGIDEWELVEVKSAVEVKDVNILDVAFQAFLLNGSGTKLRQCTLLHLNRNYVRRGDIDPSRLFVRQDVTPQALELSQDMEIKLQEMLKTAARRTCPETPIGVHCSGPFKCPLHDHCWASLPVNSVLDLYRGKRRGFDLLRRGFARIPQIPKNEPLSLVQRIQKKCILEGRPHIEREPIKVFLKQIQFPAYFLDFETFQRALPSYQATKPWQQIPFQFSLHMLSTPEAEPEHHMFLAAGDQDPRPLFLRQL